jgi:uncharacterized protein (DUF305 family)
MSLSLRRLFVALLPAVLAACSTGAGGSPAATTPAGASSSPAPSASAAAGGEIDRQFIDMMVPHHQSAVEMAKLAQERAQHSEIKALAADIIASQQSEIGRMKSWRKAWFGSEETPPMSAMPVLPGVDMPGMDGGHGGGHGGGAMDMTQDVEKLRSASTADFDRTFIDLMIPHHQSAVAAARVVLQQSAQPDVRALANEIIAAQEREIGQLEGWRKEWFPAG